jgi:transcriptional regulator with XRE-family HTH domain
MGMSAVASYLRELRVQQELSQEDLAEAMKMSLRSVNRWENEGTEGIKAEALFRAVAFLGASLHHVARLMLEVPEGHDSAQTYINGLMTTGDLQAVDMVPPQDLRSAREYLSTLDDRELLEELMRRQEEHRTQQTSVKGRRSRLRLLRRGSADQSG